MAVPLFEEVPGLERLIPIVKRKGNLHWPLLWKKVVGRRWDLAVDLRASALPYAVLAKQRHVVGRADPTQHRIVELAECNGPEAAARSLSISLAGT